jgi:hypothetical protein
MDNNDKELLIRCLVNCDDIDRAETIEQVKKCNNKIKELLSSIVIFDNKDAPTVYH